MSDNSDNFADNLFRSLESQNKETPKEDENSDKFDENVFNFDAQPPSPSEPTPATPQDLPFATQGFSSEQSPPTEQKFGDFFHFDQSPSSQSAPETSNETMDVFSFGDQTTAPTAPQDPQSAPSDNTADFFNFMDQTPEATSRENAPQDDLGDFFEFTNEAPEEDSGDTVPQSESEDFFSFTQNTGVELEPETGTQENLFVPEEFSADVEGEMASAPVGLSNLDNVDFLSNIAPPEEVSYEETSFEETSSDAQDDSEEFEYGESEESGELEEETASDEGNFFGIPSNDPQEEAPAEESAEEPTPALEDRLVRCPYSPEAFRLGDLVDAETGEPIDWSAYTSAAAGANMATADDTSDTYAFAGGGMFDVGTPAASPGGFSMDAPATKGEGAPSTPIKVRRPRPKKQSSPVRLAISIVFGGLLAFPIAHYLGIVIQKYVKNDKRRGIIEFPTPFVPETYKHIEKYPWMPTFLLMGYDEEKVKAEIAADKEAEANQEESGNLVVPDPDSSQQSDADDALSGDDSNSDFGDLDSSEEDGSDVSFDGLFGGASSEDEAEGETFDSALDDSLNEEMANVEEPLAKPASEFRISEAPFSISAAESFGTANQIEKLTQSASIDDLESIQDALRKATLAEGQPSHANLSEKTEALLLAIAPNEAECAKINGLVVDRLTPENHGEGVLLFGTAGGVRSVKGKSVFQLTLDGSKKKVYIISNADVSIPEGGRCALSGIIVSPEKDPDSRIAKGNSCTIWRGVIVDVK
ncbi:MAG: hypothetical protein Q4D38_07280 [Planctomycetia bacterium]|nr:hypothetical protein [Planctomycetia bacterium]